jgi:hypothetical protein
MYKQACARGPTVLHCYFTAAESRAGTGPSDHLFQGEAKPEEHCLGFPHLGWLSVRAFSCVLCGGLTAKNIVLGGLWHHSCVCCNEVAPLAEWVCVDWNHTRSLFSVRR